MNQKGFTIIEVSVVIFVLALLAIIGWLAYDRMQKPTSPQANKHSVRKIEHNNKTSAESNNPKTITIPSDWQWFTSNDGTTKFAYPKSWGNLLEKTKDLQAIYDTASFIGRVSVEPKEDLLVHIPQGGEDYTWYKWDMSTNTLVATTDIAPPNDYTRYSDPGYRPTSLGEPQDVLPFFLDSKNKALYEISGRGAMNCGNYHYFFNVKDKVVHIPASLCSKGGELKPQVRQAYKEDVATSLKNVLNYISD